MNSQLNSQEIKSEKVETDVIVILDESGSMETMGKEPIQSVETILQQQKLQQNPNDKSTFSLITFNTTSNVLINEERISTLDLQEKNVKYTPNACTALNDAICGTITRILASSKPKNKVCVIITDGQENSSMTYKNKDTRKMITDCETNHNWKFIFIGANINAFEEGSNLTIDKNRCGQFDQKLTGNLNDLCRSVSQHISNFRRARSDGINVDLNLTRN
jgi:Mg-chelatase subunit ChlD